MNKIELAGGNVCLYHADMREAIKLLPDNSIDSVVCDPPYHLTSIVKRFGGKNAAPAQFGTDGAFARASVGFMGKEWDGGDIAFRPETWAEVLRVLKPGGHVAAFGASRGYHRMACAIEDAGFEIRDSLLDLIDSEPMLLQFLDSLDDAQRDAFVRLVDHAMPGGTLAWLYGTGFPKSHDVSKGIDSRKDWASLGRLGAAIKAARTKLGLSQTEAARRVGLIAEDESLGGGGFMWFETGRMPTREEWPRIKLALGLGSEFDEAFEAAEREVVGQHRDTSPGTNLRNGLGGQQDEQVGAITRPMSALAKEWEGWGTALKPAFEPIVLARKPLSEGTVAANVLRWGTGALNIDACRVPSDDAIAPMSGKAILAGTSDGWDRPWKSNPDALAARQQCANEAIEKANTLGRWPANVVHDGSDEVVRAFPNTAPAKAGKPRHGKSGDGYGMTHTGAEYNDNGGSAARFFFNSKETDEQWLARNLPNAHAKPAANYFNLQSELAVSVLRNAADLSTLQLEPRKIDCPEHSMSVTPSELRRISDILTETMLSFERKSSLESLHERLSLSGNPVKFVATRRPTGTITITISPSKSDGSAEDATFSITPQNSVVGAKDCAPSTTRFHYSAKASKTDRNGSKHPTVKPVKLLQWLSRLITPPGGAVLDPFAGSGTTGAACVAEGFKCILMEREAEYVEDIKRRLSAPIVAAAVAAQQPANDNRPVSPATLDLFGEAA